MIDPKSNPGPSDVRGISDPPDPGRMRLAEEVAEKMVPDPRQDNGETVWRTTLEDAEDYVPLEIQRSHGLASSLAEEARGIVARLIRQSRAEGAAAALEEAASAVDSMADKEGVKHAGMLSFAPLPSHEVETSLRSVAAILRARAKGISDPPDPG